MNSKIYCFSFLFSLLTVYQAFSQVSKPMLHGTADLSSMVQLATGDLNYSIPVLVIPGVNESFPLYLNYSPAIGLNQEASWTGLGWFLDPGKIIRHVSQIPDDYKGQRIFTKHYDQGDFNYVEVPNFFQRLGDQVSKKMGAAANNAKWSMMSGGSQLNEMQNNLREAASAYITLGGYAGGVFNGGFERRPPEYNEKTKSYEQEWAGSAGVNPIALFKAIRGPKVNFPHLTNWDWTILEERKKRKFLWFTTNWDKSIRYTWYLDELKEEQGYGILYQSAIPKTLTSPGSGSLFNPQFSNSSNNQDFSYFNTVIYEPDNTDRSLDGNYASDYYQAPAKDKKEYENTSPIYWAPDFYRVAAWGLGGELQPVRFDNTSVATSFPSNKFYYPRIAMHKHSIAPAQPGKVQFIMLEDQSNTYQYHREALANSYGLQYTPTATEERDGRTINTIRLNEQSPGLTTTRPADEGFNGDNIVYKGVGVYWYSVAEINDGTAKSAGFIDAANTVRLNTSPNSIGGFTVIDKRGYSYHFAIPVYGTEEQTIMTRYPKEDNPGQFGETTGKNYYETKYPTSWLLTAVTGPDFTDSGLQQGFIDDQDKGHFVKLEYGKYQEAFEEKTPKVGAAYTPDDAKAEISTTNIRQEYYLNTITTPTHTALFVKKVRQDNQSIKGQSIVETSLALDEIILLQNADYKYLVDALGLQYHSQNLDQYLAGLTGQVLKKEDILSSTAIKEYIQKKALQRISFEYDYSLCPGAPNALAGKLTLKKLHTYGKESQALIPPYEFGYNTNPAYHQHAWDAWGLYKNNQVAGIDKHKVENGTDGAAWSLSQITTPLGAAIQISYERDQYATVSGAPLETGITAKWGGNLRVKEIKMKQGDQTLAHHQYDYTNTGTSSGVATMEPSFCKGLERAWDEIYRYPAPLVTYGRVIHLQVQKDGSTADRQVVSTFHTADQNTVSINKVLDEQVTLTEDFETFIPTGPFLEKVKLGYDLRQAGYETTYQDNKIGLVSSVEEVGKQGQVISNTTYTYEPAQYGSFTQGLHLMDNTYRAYASPPGEEGKIDKRMSYRFINSVSTQSPYRLKSIATKSFKTGIQDTKTYLDQDIYTGETTRVLQEDAYGNALLSEVVSAYKQYPQMGPALRGGNNRLRETAATYAYKVDVNKNPVGLLSAATQTFSDQTPTLGYTQAATGIWRPQSIYQWNGQQEINADGTYPIADFNASSFNWSNPTANTKWEKTGEATFYDMYLRPLEVKDINGNRTATRTDKNQQYIIASTTNATYHEMAFSGAELFAGNADEEGGVARGQGYPSTAHAHTGKYSLLVAPDKTGFQCTLQASKADLSRRYRASVWVYVPGEGETQPELNKVELFYAVNGQVMGTIKPILQKNKSKSWYLLNLDIIPNGSGDVVVGCKNSAGRGIYFDDFRVHPIDASMTSYVYDPFTGELTYTLDANNFYTRFEYDAMGRNVRTSKELLNFDFGDGKESYRADKIINEVKYNYGRNTN